MHEDWKNVFGQAPDSFSARVYYTVKDLPETKKSPKRFLFPKRFVIGLCTLAIILTSAMAAGQKLGLDEYFRHYRGISISEEAANLVERDISGMIEVAKAHFSVREAVCDGETFYVILECRAPKDFLLAAMDASPGDKAAQYDLTVPGDSRSLRQYAQDRGKELLYVNAGIYADGQPVVSSSDWWLEEDGVLCMWFSGQWTEENYTCSVRVVHDWDSTTAKVFDGSFPFTLQNRVEPEDVEFSLNNVVFGGVKLNQLSLKQTPLGTYVQICGEYLEESSKATPLWFRIWDDRGNLYDSGLSGVGTITTQGSEVTYDLCLEPGDIPEILTLEGYDRISGNSYGSVKLDLALNRTTTYH